MFEAIAQDENLDDLFSESASFERAQMFKPQIEEIVTDENLDNFLVAEDSEFALANVEDNFAMSGANLDHPEVDVFKETETLIDLNSESSTSKYAPQENIAESSQDFEDINDIFGDQDQFSPSNRLANPDSNILNPEPDLGNFTNQENISEYGTNWDADIYIQASPEESLLPIAAPQDEQEAAILLDANTLQLLQSDLFSLEGIDTSNPPASVSIADSEPFSFSDFSVVEAENPFVVSEEVTSLDDLFAEVSSMPISPVLASSSSSFSSFSSAANESPATSSLSEGVTLDDILANLMEAEVRPLNYPPTDINTKQVITASKVTSGWDNPGREKKN